MKVITNAFWLSFGRIAAELLSFVLFAAISRTFGLGLMPHPRHSLLLRQPQAENP
jgi:O-antigen/teichoic acid export membrane protein